MKVEDNHQRAFDEWEAFRLEDFWTLCFDKLLGFIIDCVGEETPM